MLLEPSLTRNKRKYIGSSLKCPMLRTPLTSYKQIFILKQYKQIIILIEKNAFLD